MKGADFERKKCIFADEMTKLRYILLLLVSFFALAFWASNDKDSECDVVVFDQEVASFECDDDCEDFVVAYRANELFKIPRPLRSMSGCRTVVLKHIGSADVPDYIALQERQSILSISCILERAGSYVPVSYHIAFHNFRL